MKTSINTWLEKALETGAVDEQQIIVVYDKNNNIEYLGKADFAPLTLWDEFKTAVIVGSELHINERQCNVETTEPETIEMNVERMRECLESTCGIYIGMPKSRFDSYTIYHNDRFIALADTFKEAVAFSIELTEKVMDECNYSNDYIKVAIKSLKDAFVVK